MLILPLPTQPNWSRPPFITLGLILFCCIVFTVFQGTDQTRELEALTYYKHSVLPDLELPAYLTDLRARGKESLSYELSEAMAQDMEVRVLMTMESDHDFMQRLHAGQVITAEMPDFEGWRAHRERYEKLRERIFTEQYSLDPSNPTPTTLVSHMFLHANVQHLAGNMVVLFIVGYTVEASLGALGFLFLFVAGGLGACVPELLLPARYGSHMLGASGAISAVMASYLVLFGMRRIRFFYWFLIFFNTVRWPALMILPVWLGNELLQKYVFDRNGNVAYLAHFGGFLTGALLTALYRWHRGWHTAENVERLNAEARAANLREQAAQHVASARFDRAAPIYRRLIEAEPNDDQAFAEYLRVATLAPKAGLTSHAARRLLWRSGKGDSWLPPDLIVQAMHEIDAAGIKLPTLSLRAWDRIARRLIEAGEFDTAESLVMRLVSRDPEGKIAPGLLYRLSRAWRSVGRPAEAERTREILIKRFPDRHDLL
ncbi:MAG: rhomboid family intramembrane serine protease [Betaproteobacteria bacterium]|nr:rhomboid family intramembrane serine protease [Betaproteobacteria bacterium]